MHKWEGLHPEDLLSTACSAASLEAYLRYYNGDRIHLGIKGLTPDEKYAQILAEKMKPDREALREVIPTSKVA